MERESVVDKVAKLLTRAEHKNTPEAEAAACFAKAQQLMTQHAIEQIELEGRGEAPMEKIVRVDVSNLISVRDEIKTAKQWMLQSIAEANRCRYVWISGGKHYEHHILLGFETDVAFVQLLYSSASMQMAIARGRALKDTWDREYVSRYVFVRSFAEGYALRVKTRLENAVKEASTGAELVLFGRKAKVDEEFDNIWGDCTAKEKKLAKRDTDYRARGAGAAAADRADLSGGRNQVTQ